MFLETHVDYRVAHREHEVEVMKTLRTVAVGMLLAVAASVAAAADESTVLTITVTAKRHTPAVERVPPQAAAVEAKVVLPTDMPEADIDFHLQPIDAHRTSTVHQATP
jgi:hypothetical protein